MTSLSQLLINREIGFPKAQFGIKQAVDRKTEDHLAKDYFDFKTIELSRASFHHISRNQDFVTVLSTNKTDQKTQRLALFSLDTGCKLWDLEITQIFKKASSSRLSECGMVLVNSPLTKAKIIVLDGKQSGVLPDLNWRFTVLVGRRILGHWTEPRDQNGERRLPEKLDAFFGEWNEEGASLSRGLLDSSPNRLTYWYACNENYWVRLSGGKQTTSIIEVVNRVLRTIETFELPSNKFEERFSSACIVQNLLFYGKHLISYDQDYDPNPYKPTIGVYDLIKGQIIEEFSTRREHGESKQLVANQHYAAWLSQAPIKSVDGQHGDGYVQYKDLASEEIQVATNISYIYLPKVILNILGTLLSITYEEQHHLRRKVIEMTNGKLKCDVRYKKSPFGGCCISNKTLVITDVSSSPQIYIENFLGQGPSNEESPFRE